MDIIHFPKLKKNIIEQKGNFKNSAVNIVKKEDNEIKMASFTLNKIQQSAVEALNGPVLIFAGAGSGKTRVLTHKISYLIDTGKYKPENILAVTFTNKAAKEMRDRVEKIIESTEARNLWMGTFHSVFSRILRIVIYRGIPAFQLSPPNSPPNSIKVCAKKIGTLCKIS